jgi:dimethylamine monooxygenase subunit A
MAVILQDRLREMPWMAPHTWRLPGTVPVPLSEWFVRDEAHAAHLSLRDRLIAERPDAVLAGDLRGAAAREILALVLELAGAIVEDGAAVRPDGVRVNLEGAPLAVAARLVQEDLLLLERRPGEEEHRLTAGCLCFPAHWTLAEKLGEGLARIHGPVAAYDAALARRVQRMLDGLAPLTPLKRANVARHAHPGPFAPLREADPRPPATGRYLRVERQCLVKLPATRAVAFTIHTSLVEADSLEIVERAALDVALGAARRPAATAEAR